MQREKLQNEYSFLQGSPKVIISSRMGDRE
jgi:hypothetical protein